MEVAPPLIGTTRRAIGIVTELAATSDEATRRAMGLAFRESAAHERAFFAARRGAPRA